MDKELENSQYSVLIVDDYESFRKSVSSYLAASGMTVTAVPGGQEAIELLHNKDIDIAIVDYFMPGMTGEELIRRIREFNKNIIIILVTAHSGEKPAIEMLEALDIQGYYDKDSDIEDLYLLVHGAKSVCRQLRKNLEMSEEVSLSKDNAAMQEILTGIISHNIKNSNVIVASNLQKLEELAKKLKDLVNKEGRPEKEKSDTLEDMLRLIDMSKGHARYIAEVIEKVKKQAV